MIKQVYVMCLLSILQYMDKDKTQHINKDPL